MSFSKFGNDSPPNRALTPKGLNYMQRMSPVVIEHNYSYARAGNTPSGKTENSNYISHTMRPSESNESDEDARFLRLAHEALVATSTESNLIVDPTIQDLLARLQYVSSPHGNPIRRSEDIRSNENGQLMIQNFYKEFPNFSTDVFSDKEPSPQASQQLPSQLPNHMSHPGDKKNEDWNFLLENSVDISQTKPLEAPGLTVTAKRNFPCSNCSMSFRRSSDLKRHAKQHLAIPANICSACGKGFARRDALKRHTGTLTCKRNADKDLYAENLEYERGRRRPSETNEVD